MGSYFWYLARDREDESIIRVEKNEGDDGTFDVQFGKVWKARGCATLLDGDKRLFDGKITVDQRNH